VALWLGSAAPVARTRGSIGAAELLLFTGHAPNDEGEQRLTALVGSNDGFELAEIDLEMRGEGTLLGSRQKGRSDLKLAKLKSDETC